MNIEDRKLVGKKLREARIKMKLTQVEAADKAGIADGYYARLERGEENPTVTVLEGICKALHVKSSKILSF